MNYKEESSEDDLDETFNSVVSNLSLPATPLSPSNPNFLLQVSPPPTSQVLKGAAYHLKTVEAIQSVVPNWPPFEESGEEPIEEIIMPDNDDAVELDFEDENGQDGDKAIEYTRTLKLEFSPEEVEFWFTQLENEMFTCSVKSQWLKRCVLVKNLPPKVQADVKSILTLKKSEAPTNVYKVIKAEILRIHAPKCEETFKKALSRVLTGLPSQLGQTLINDICDKPVKLSGCCCSKAVLTLWALQLPVSVRSHIANMTFNVDTYAAVFQAADKVFLSTKATELSAGVAAIAVTPGQTSTPEVAAVRPRNRNNGQRNQNQNNGTRRSGNSGGGNKPQNSKPDATNAPSSCCSNHKKWADQAWYCLAPLTCPWKNKCSARPEKEEKK